MGALHVAAALDEPSDNALCIIKTLKPGIASRDNDEYLRRFLDEARVARLLNHEHLCHVFDAGEVDGELFLAMELIEGVTFKRLDELVERGAQRLPLEHVVALGVGLGLGLHAAHVAVVVYELVTGDRYYGDLPARAIWGIAGAGTHKPRAWSALPSAVAGALAPALAADRGDRYASCEAFAAALARAVKPAGASELAALVAPRIASDLAPLEEARAKLRALPPEVRANVAEATQRVRVRLLGNSTSLTTSDLMRTVRARPIASGPTEAFASAAPHSERPQSSSAPPRVVVNALAALAGAAITVAAVMGLRDEAPRPPPAQGAPPLVAMGAPAPAAGVDAELGATAGLGTCTTEACFADVAEALGADTVVVAQLTQLEGEVLFGLRRIEQAKQEVTGSVLERVPASDLTHLLPLIGPSVDALFPDAPLRSGETLGLDERGLRALTPPPPLSPAVTLSLGGGQPQRSASPPWRWSPPRSPPPTTQQTSRPRRPTGPLPTRAGCKSWAIALSSERPSVGVPWDVPPPSASPLASRRSTRTGSRSRRVREGASNAHARERAALGRCAVGWGLPHLPVDRGGRRALHG